MQILSNLNTLVEKVYQFKLAQILTITKYVYNTNVNCQINSNKEFSSGCAFIWHLMFVYQFMNKSAVMYAFSIICFYICTTEKINTENLFSFTKCSFQHIFHTYLYLYKAFISLHLDTGTIFSAIYSTFIQLLPPTEMFIKSGTWTLSSNKQRTKNKTKNLKWHIFE